MPVKRRQLRRLALRVAQKENKARRRERETRRTLTGPIRGCFGKDPFPSRDAAETAIRWRHQREIEQMNAYACPLCGDWHIGHKPIWSPRPNRTKLGVRR